MKTTRIMQWTHVLLRLVAGLLFMQHGGQKLFGWFGGIGPAPGSTVNVMSQIGFAGVLEFGGGLAIMLGLLTRPVAFLLCGEMAVAYFTAHQPHGTWPIQNHGESAVLFAFIFMFLAGNGSGGFGLDALFHVKKSRPVGMAQGALLRDMPAMTSRVT